MTHHDMVIRGGRVIDGTGRAAFTADVAVDGGLITTAHCADSFRSASGASMRLYLPDCDTIFVETRQPQNSGNVRRLSVRCPRDW